MSAQHVMQINENVFQIHQDVPSFQRSSITKLHNSTLTQCIAFNTNNINEPTWILAESSATIPTKLFTDSCVIIDLTDNTVLRGDLSDDELTQQLHSISLVNYSRI